MSNNSVNNNNKLIVNKIKNEGNKHSSHKTVIIIGNINHCRWQTLWPL